MEAKKKRNPEMKTNPGHTTKTASWYPIDLAKGSTITGRFPPMLFMMKRKRAMQVDLTSGAQISVITVKRMANQVSAVK